MEFTENHLQKVSELRKTVLFAEESKYNEFGSDGHNYVWRITRGRTSEKKISVQQSNMVAVA
jgi:hypothetical protein